MENRFSVFEPAYQIRKKLFPWGGSGRDGNGRRGRPADVTFQVFVVEAGGISDVQELNATAIYAGVEDSFDSPIRTLQIA